MALSTDWIRRNLSYILTLGMAAVPAGFVPIKFPWMVPKG